MYMFYGMTQYMSNWIVNIYIFYAFIDLFQAMLANFPQKYRQKHSQMLHVNLTMSALKIDYTRLSRW